MKENTTPEPTRNTTNPAGSTNERAKQHTTKHHSTRVNPPSKKSEQRRKTRAAAAKPASFELIEEHHSEQVWEGAENPLRPEIDLILKHFPGADKVPLAGSIANWVNQLYRFALKQNPYKLLWLATASRVFLPYYAKHPNAYSGPDLFFTERGIAGGGSAKVEQFVSMAEVMLDQYVIAKDGSKQPNTLWFGGFNAAKGGLVMWLVGKAKTARQRVLKEEYDRAEGKSKYYDRNLIAEKGISLTPKLNDEGEAEELAEKEFATRANPLAEEVREGLELMDETHRKGVGFVRRVVELFMTWTPASRREWREYLLDLMEYHDVTPAEAGFPSAWAQRKEERKPDKGQRDRRWQTLLNLLKDANARGPGLGSFQTVLVTD